jgi:S1-C subfamily serine protease/regulator of sirC expression with transglutaminase-like and TPR domain
MFEVKVPWQVVALLMMALGEARLYGEEPGPAIAERATPSASLMSTELLNVERLTQLVRRSVVVVSFTGRDNKTVGLGSGFVISKDGLIATNLHVIGEARPIFVQTADGKRHPVTEIHATDRAMDLAIIKIAAKDLPPLPLGDSSALKQGEDIVALGNPEGLTFSVVKGVVSGRREIDGKPMIQLAIPIEQGNSGGPLLDRFGRVHGILTMKSLVTRNLGFAVEINSLKPLLEKPNPVPLSRWLTIGALDAKRWQTVFGANWRQRAGRITVSGPGEGFGGRSLALSTLKPPEVPFEVAVTVKLADEEGAAGLVVHADGTNKHYGFYPSAGQLRFSRFDGPDVLAWQVLEEVKNPHYRPGEWNTLKVRVERNRIKCFINDQLAIESADDGYQSGQVGLAKFRDTEAEFKGFQIADHIPPSRPSEDAVARIRGFIEAIELKHPPTAEFSEKLLPDAASTTVVLEEEAKRLEQKAQRLRQLARQVHETRVRTELARLFEGDGENVDLLKAALHIAWLDNEEILVKAYLDQVDEMVGEIQSNLAAVKEPTDEDTLKALDRYLFEQMGFHGSRTNYYSSSNSYLNEVLDDREGLPILLSVLYIEMAKRLGVKVVGVGLPGHFVVRHEPKNGQGQLIDPFDRGSKLSREEAVQLVEQNTGRPFDAEVLRSQTPKEIVVRMLMNLMNVARDANDPETMLRYVETMVAIKAENAEFHWFRAVLRYQTDRHAEALKDTAWLMEKNPVEVDMPRVRGLHQLLEEELQNAAE